MRKYVPNPSHILPDLSKSAPQGELLAQLERILKVENQHQRNKTFRRFYVKWMDYPEEEASWEREVDFRRYYLDFVIEYNDFKWKGSIVR